MYIRSNVSALFAENAIAAQNATLEAANQQIATGSQLTSPSDNPSASAIFNLGQGELGAMTQASQNVAQGVDLLNTANGAVQSDIQIVQQMQSLAVQASNGTNTSQDRADIQSQIQALASQIDQNSQVSYNGQALLTGQFSSQSGVQLISQTVFEPNQSTFTPEPGTAVITAESGLPVLPSTADSYFLHISRANTSGSFGTGGSISNDWINAEGPTSSGEPSAYKTYVTPPVPATVGTVTLSGVHDGTPWSITATYDLPVQNTADQLRFQVQNPGTPLALQTGPTNATANRMAINLPTLTSVGLNLNTLSLSSPDAIALSQSLIAGALGTLTTAQSQIGSQLDQLQAGAGNLANEALTTQASQATIGSANIANAASQISRSQLLAQTGLSALAAADRLPGAVLSILG